MGIIGNASAAMFPFKVNNLPVLLPCAIDADSEL